MTQVIESVLECNVLAMIKETIFVVFLAVVVLFNIVGNSLVIYIITTERGPKTSTNYLLLSLAVADMIFGIFIFPEFIFLQVGVLEHPKGFLGDILCKTLTGSGISWVAGESALMIVMTLIIERYFAVCRPHSFRQRFSPRKVKRVILCSWVFAIVSMTPLLVNSCFDPNLNICRLQNQRLEYIYGVVVAMECIVSFIIVIVLSVKITLSLWCKQTVIQPTARREIEEAKRKKKVTISVLAVVVTFILCYTSAFLGLLVYLVAREGVAIMEGMEYTPVVSGVLVAINAALDPFLYSFQSPRFKKYIKKIICCKNSQNS